MPKLHRPAVKNRGSGSARESKRPNLLRCTEKACGHTIDYAGQKLPMACPRCDGKMTARCGTGPRPPSRTHPCYVECEPHMRCHLHGGASLKGPAHPRWVNGEKSRYLPKRWCRDRFEHALDDPLAQREQRVQLAYMEELQNEALKRLDGTESGETWDLVQKSGRRLRTLTRSLRLARDKGQSDRAGRLETRLLRALESDHLALIEKGAGEEAARRELVDLFQKRARMIRVQHLGEKTVPIEVLGVLQARFVALMAQYVRDNASLSSLVAEMRAQTLPGWTAIPAKVINGMVRP